MENREVPILHKPQAVGHWNPNSLRLTLFQLSAGDIPVYPNEEGRSMKIALFLGA
jgi:hypothetical protein